MGTETVERCEKCGCDMDTKRFEVAWEIDHHDYQEMINRIPEKYKMDEGSYFGHMFGKYIIKYLEELRGGPINRDKFTTLDVHDDLICKRAANARAMQ